MTALDLRRFIVQQLFEGAYEELVDSFLQAQVDAAPCPKCRRTGTYQLVSGHIWRDHDKLEIRAYVCQHCKWHILPTVPESLSEVALENESPAGAAEPRP